MLSKSTGGLTTSKSLLPPHGYTVSRDDRPSGFMPHMDDGATPDGVSSNQTPQDLARLLRRLDSSVTSRQGERDLRRSSYQRQRVGSNLAYARNLLLKLEHDPSRSRSSTGRGVAGADLQEQKVLVKRLEERLFELNQSDSGQSADAEGDLSSDEDAEEVMRRYAPAVPVAQSGIDLQSNGVKGQTSTQRATMNAASRLESSIRLRRQQQGGNPDSTSGESTGRDGFQPSSSKKARPIQPPSGLRPTSTPVSNTETLMTHHSSEQDALTTSLLSLASALRSSTVSFSDSLAASNPLVDRTASSLDRNVGGMEAAEKRMGMLRRMTEGKGWWARIGLYAWVALLWVALILIMFVMPKLRF